MPGGYGGYAVSPGSAGEALPNPGAATADDGSSFSIPLPGGGEIQVNGPPSEPSNIPPPPEIGRGGTPLSPAGTPIGPGPPR